MDAVGGHHIKCSKPGSEKQRACVFSHMCMIDPKNKHIHQNKHYHIQPYVEHVYNKWDSFMELGEGGKGKKKGRTSAIL
jgi:hypothetical protein